MAINASHPALSPPKLVVGDRDNKMPGTNLAPAKAKILRKARRPPALPWSSHKKTRMIWVLPCHNGRLVFDHSGGNHMLARYFYSLHGLLFYRLSPTNNSPGLHSFVQPCPTRLLRVILCGHSSPQSYVLIPRPGVVSRPSAAWGLFGIPPVVL